jgi:hypothetical protein
MPSSDVRDSSESSPMALAMSKIEPSDGNWASMQVGSQYRIWFAGGAMRFKGLPQKKKSIV